MHDQAWVFDIQIFTAGSTLHKSVCFELNWIRLYLLTSSIVGEHFRAIYVLFALKSIEVKRKQSKLDLHKQHVVEY